MAMERTMPKVKPGMMPLWLRCVAFVFVLLVWCGVDLVGVCEWH